MAFQSKGNVFTLENNSTAFRHMKIGSTFDCVQCKPCDNLPEKQCSGTIQEEIGTCGWNLLEVKNKRSLHDAFGLKTTMSLKVWAGQIDADALLSFEEKLSEESDKTWLMFACRFERMKEMLPSKKPRKGKSRNYGTHYVRSLVRGGRVFILCQLSSSQTIKSIDTKFKQITTLNPAKRFKLAEQKLQLSGSTSSQNYDDFADIRFYSTVRTTKQPTTSSEVYSYIKTFPKELEKETKFEPVQFELCPFEMAKPGEYSSDLNEFSEAFEDVLEAHHDVTKFIKSDTFSRIDQSGKREVHKFREEVKLQLQGFNESIRKASMEGLTTHGGETLKAYNKFISDNSSEALLMTMFFKQLKAKLSGLVDRIDRLMPSKAATPPLHDLTVLVVGHTGTGKTALVEFLSTGKPGGGTDTNNSRTDKFEEVKTTFKDKNIIYLDTPGFYDTNSDKMVLSINEIKKALKATQNGCDIILFVVNVRQNQTRTEYVFKHLQDYHGPDIVKHMIVIFTFTETRKKKLDLDSMKNDDRWKQILAKCGNRAIGIDSLKMTTRQEHNTVSEYLITMMNRLYLNNDKKSYKSQVRWSCTLL